MNYKELFADQSTIQLSVMKIEGKKLTRSLMDQMPSLFPFDKQLNFTGEKIFGFVKYGKIDSNNPRAMNVYFGIAQEDGKILKFSLDKIHSIAHLKISDSLLDYSHRYLKDILGDDPSLFTVDEPSIPGFLSKFDPENIIENQLTPSGVEKLENIVAHCKALYKELMERQIYI